MDVSNGTAPGTPVEGGGCFADGENELAGELVCLAGGLDGVNCGLAGLCFKNANDKCKPLLQKSLAAYLGCVAVAVLPCYQQIAACNKSAYDTAKSCMNIFGGCRSLYQQVELGAKTQIIWLDHLESEHKTGFLGQ